MKLAAVLLGLLLAVPAFAQSDPAPSDAPPADADPVDDASTDVDEASADADPADTPAEAPADDVDDERAGWTATQWMADFYQRKADGETEGLRELLERAARAPDSSPALAQQIAGETGYLAKAQSQLERAGSAFRDASEGPDPDAAANAAAELEIVRGYLLVQGREQRDAGLFDDAEATFAVAVDLGADPSLMTLERAKVLQRRQRVANGAPASAGTWGRPPAASEALGDPLPPPLEEVEWLAEFNAQKAAGAAPEGLEQLLAALEGDDVAQRVAIERGYLGLDASDPLAAGRAFLAAREGDDPGLTARAQAELRALQRHFRALAVQSTHVGNTEQAEEDYLRAEALGADPQLIAWELAYLATLDGDADKVTDLLQQASRGPNEAVREQATAELAAREAAAQASLPAWQRHLNAAVDHRSMERWAEAEAELDVAEEAGASPQLIQIHRGYLDRDQQEDFKARKHFVAARDGDDEALSKQAKAELRYTAKPLWADVYAEGFGWARILPESQRFDDFVGMVRVRGYLHPFPKIGFDPYIFVQVSGDVRSRQDGGALAGGQPLIYADNSALFGGGLLLRFWKNRISLWGQAAAAIPWVKPAGADDVQFDVQVGGAITFSTEGCRPPDGKPAYFTTMLCAEFYGDTVYRNRPYNNVFFGARGRIGLHYLVTGPVAWSPVAEVRFGKDVLNDYWANLIDVGLMHRWRLMGPVGIDLLAGIHGGTLLGLAGADPAPPILSYVDLRLQIMGYVSF